MMQKRLWINLILLVATLGLAAVVFLKPGVEEPSLVHLAELDDSTIDRITLQNKETIQFEKREGHWWITLPFSAPANEIRIRQLLEIADAESEARYPLKTEEHAKYELDKPKATLTLGSVKLVFGGSDPIDMRRYVWVGETVHLVNDDFSHHLVAAATDYVDKKLLPEGSRPKELFVPGLKATLSADGKWVAEPSTDQVGAVAELVNAWQSARAIEVKRMAQAPQGDVVRIGYSDHAPIEFILTQREPDLVLARPEWGLLYVMPSESAKSLLTLQPTQPKGLAAPPSGMGNENKSNDGLQDEGEEDMDTPEDTSEIDEKGLEMDPPISEGDPKNGADIKGEDVEDQE